MDKTRLPYRGPPMRFGSNSNVSRSGSSSNVARVGSSSTATRNGSTSNIARVGSNTNVARAGPISSVSRNGSTSNMVRVGSNSNVARAGPFSSVSRNGSTLNLVRVGSNSNVANRHNGSNSSVMRFSHSSAAKDLKDILERKIEDLSRLLTEERQKARQTRSTLARVQKELNRAKTHNSKQGLNGKEQLSKELEHERLLRVEAERRLHEMTRESQTCQLRLESLQEEFKKMEGIVRDMLQYKSKIDQLKQEKSSLSVTYDNNIHKFKKHITDLERENMLLLNEVKKLECQINSKTDGRDRSKLLLERLKMLEGENSSLVLENEQQRGQYEKCLDEIANQVVQALLAQKMLREECVKLQGRVRDLEFQNRQLCVMFSQRMKLAAEAAAQGTANGESLSPDIFLQGSMESLQSMFSEQTSENLPNVPKMSSPPPWLQERLAGDRRSIVSFTGSYTSTPDLDMDFSSPQSHEFQCRTEIETEFPATPSSPKSKHVSFYERKPETKRSSSTSSLTSSNRGPTRPRTRSTSSLSRARGLSLFSPPQHTSRSEESGIENSTTKDNSSQHQDTSDFIHQEGSDMSPSSTNHIAVPLNQSNPSISNDSSQGHIDKFNTKIPLGGVGARVKDEGKLRRNSLKAEYSIRMGCQSMQQKSVHSNSSTKQQSGKQPKPKSPSITSQSQLRTASGTPRSASAGSRIPMVSRQTNQNNVRTPSRESINARSNESVKSTSVESMQSKSSDKSFRSNKSDKSSKSNSDKTHKSKVSISKLTSPTSKLVPPKSPNLRYSGIRTTLKNESASKSVATTKSGTKTTTTNQGGAVVSGINSVSLKMRSVYAIDPKSAKHSGEIDKKEEKPPLPVKGERPIHQRPETHYPIMGLTTLNHTSPKNETADTAVYTNLISTPSMFSSVAPPAEKVCVADTPSETNNKGQYFYDYSDEDSDFNRPVSKDFSIASTVSLDELLDHTLEGMSTPLDSDFKSELFLLSLTNDGQQMTCENVKEMVENRLRERKSMEKELNHSEKSNQVEGNKKSDAKNAELENRLHEKPDIVKDTEECEQRNLKKSITISQIPGSSLPGYRAKRPKSLILGAKEKKFLYCEYGSSSSSDTSDEEWSYQYSYAKNVKQQEIQSKVAKSLKNGEAKVIDSPGDGTTKIDIKSVKAISETQDKQSGIPTKSHGNKKPSKLPPPVASKPMRKYSLPETSSERPKSVEICVNTALTSINSKAYYSILGKCQMKDITKCDSEKMLNLQSSFKSENPEMTLNSTFDEVKVERSGSKDDGYSTMSSDIQPEVLEKYSDVLESSTNSNDNIRNSNLSLSSQNSFSSEDRQSFHGSLGRVRAMKLKFEIDNPKSLEHDSLSPKSPPKSPSKMLQQSPKRSQDNLQCSSSKFSMSTSVECIKSDRSPIVTTGRSVSPKSAIPMSISSTSKIAKPSGIPRKDKCEPKSSSLPVKSKLNNTVKDKNGTDKNCSTVKDKYATGRNSSMVTDSSTAVINKYAVIDKSGFDKTCEQILSKPRSSLNDTVKKTSTISQNENIGVINSNIQCTPPRANVIPYNVVDMFPQTSTPKHILDQFTQLSEFAPTYDKLLLLQETGGDSNSSLSDRGSDLTSLHISEDNILSDIPEEREGYESSVGHRSECNSITSIPTTVSVKKVHKAPSHQSHNQSHTSFTFSTKLRRYWSSIDGLVRAASDIEYNKQQQAKDTMDYEELYGGCLNIETLLERSSSESDMLTRGDKPEVILLPRLPRSVSVDGLVLDEIVIEEKVQAILKQNMLNQICQSVQSAEKDDAQFSSFVELLIQRGHVLESQSPDKGADKAAPVLNKMAVSTLSSKGANSSMEYFEVEEGEKGQSQQQEVVTSPSPVGDEQKKFNSQFYSLCNTGSSRSISDRSESQGTEAGGQSKPQTIHMCQKGDDQCKKCEEEKNLNEFDHISKQIESLSKTVNELHRSLSSLNSENSESGSESNEGDSELQSAFGNKDIDGYQWVEDEFFLSPYGGEVILGGSPFSNTGASCDWMNEYTDNAEHVEETGGQEAMHEEMAPDIPFDSSNNAQQTRNRPTINSVLAGSIDEEGNFDSHHFISKRLEMEEMRLKSLTNDNFSHKATYDNANMVHKRSRIPPPTALKLKTRPLLKEDTKTTPEKDVDDSDVTKQKSGLEMPGDRMLMHYGSQDSLDDNIGVDSMISHRLIGGNGGGPNAAARPNPCSRPALDFSNNQFIRYGDLEQQAVAAFDFLNEMTSSIKSDQSTNQKITQDTLRRMEETRMAIAANRNRMNCSTTSNESRTSPVKRCRRKLRPRISRDKKVDLNMENKNTRKFSSTSADESDGDPSLSDSCSDDCNANERCTINSGAKVMTYI